MKCNVYTLLLGTIPVLVGGSKWWGEGTDSDSTVDSDSKLPLLVKNSLLGDVDWIRLRALNEKVEDEPRHDSKVLGGGRVLKKSKVGKASRSISKTSKKSKGNKAMWTMTDLRESGKPYAIGHRGFGNTVGVVGSDGLPRENSIDAVVAAFEVGARIVEIDVVLDGDGNAFVNHDDWLSVAGLPCINQLTTEELKQRLPNSTTLSELLKAAKPFARTKTAGAKPSGLVSIEVKPPSPLCDPDDATEAALMTAVLSAIEQVGMTEQVEIISFSPALLALAKSNAETIPRGLLVGVLQMLPPADVEQATGLNVTGIEKEPDFGLQWGEIGQFYRFPAYASFNEIVVTLTTTLAAACVSFDKQILGQPQAGANVPVLQALGLHVYGWTVEETPEWNLLEQLGVNGIVTNLIEEGVALQAD